MPLLFALTMFVSATLLFLVQPMIGKMVLPLLGGTPAVWNTCMVFYQALLLLGYYYAHRSTSRFNPKQQTKLHAGVMLAALAVLAIAALLTAENSPIPIVKSLSPQGDNYPFFGVIVLLAVAIGLPFFVVSTSAPLLQKWFAETGHPSAKDPYFLYAASNFGSLLALVAYPAIVEPNLRLIHQAWVWAIGYAILVGLVAVCARVVSKAPPPLPEPPVVRGKPRFAKPDPIIPEAEPTTLRKLHWLALAFVPSSLMLGVTTFVSTDMASIPLLWIIPLSLYLITFIIVFSKVPPIVHLSMTLLMPVMVLLIAFLMTSHVKAKFGLQVLLHMSTFFVVTMVCHGELARNRPSAKYLTNFYLIMSIGGMLGGLFNALAAPIVFTFTSEYPITLVLACFLLPSLFDDKDRKLGNWTQILDVLLPLSIFFICRILQPNAHELTDYFYENGKYMITASVLYALPALLVLFVLVQEMRLRIVLGILLGGGLLLFAMSAPFMGYIDHFLIRQLAPASEESGQLAHSALSLAVRLLPVAVLAGVFVWYWKRNGPASKRMSEIGMGLGTLGISLALMLTLTDMLMRDVVSDMAANANISEKTVMQILVYGVPAMLCYFFVERPIRFGAAVGALWLATFYTEYKEERKAGVTTVHDRSFFGRLKIEKSGQWEPISFARGDGELALLPRAVFDPDAYTMTRTKKTTDDDPEDTITFHTKSNNQPVYKIEVYKTKDGYAKKAFIYREFTELVHGTTVHGVQEVNRQRRDIATALLPAAAANWVGEAAIGLQYEKDILNAMQAPGRSPLTYYHRNGPVGAIFQAWRERNKGNPNANTNVACVGMGTASLTAYGMPKQTLVIYEIDNHVRRLVEPPLHFDYVQQAKDQGVNVEFEMGDARISLERKDRKFGLILLDAFSSDSIPAHLLTKQAFKLYFDRMDEDGILAVHISNRYLDLEPVVERLVRELGLHARIMHGDKYRPSRDPLTEEGRFGATWIAIARSEKALGAIEEDGQRYDKEEKPSSRDRWIPLTKDNAVGLWTDDFSPIIPILRGEWRFWERAEE